MCDTKKLLKKIDNILKNKRTGLSTKEIKQLKSIRKELALADTAEQILNCLLLLSQLFLAGKTIFFDP